MLESTGAVELVARRLLLPNLPRKLLRPSKLVALEFLRQLRVGKFDFVNFVRLAEDFD